MLSSEQENELHAYLIQTQKEGYGLTPKLLKELTFSYCSHNHIEMISTWSENGCAGNEWFRNFIKPHRKLSLRKPEGTSIARAKCMNRPVMNKQVILPPDGMLNPISPILGSEILYKKEKESTVILNCMGNNQNLK